MRRVLTIVAGGAAAIGIAACTQSQAQQVAQRYAANACGQISNVCTVPLPSCVSNSGAAWHCVGSFTAAASGAVPHHTICRVTVDVFDSQPFTRNGVIGPCEVG